MTIDKLNVGDIISSKFGANLSLIVAADYDEERKLLIGYRTLDTLITSYQWEIEVLNAFWTKL